MLLFLVFPVYTVERYHISACIVKAKLLKLKMNKAPVVDLIETRMLAELAEEISYTVEELLYICIKRQSICRLEIGQFYAIFKKSKKSIVANYRPVSLTVKLCKVFELIMRDKMIKHLERYIGY